MALPGAMEEKSLGRVGIGTTCKVRGSTGDQHGSRDRPRAWFVKYIKEVRLH